MATLVGVRWPLVALIGDQDVVYRVSCWPRALVRVGTLGPAVHLLLGPFTQAPTHLLSDGRMSPPPGSMLLRSVSLSTSYTRGASSTGT